MRPRRVVVAMLMGLALLLAPGIATAVAAQEDPDTTEVDTEADATGEKDEDDDIGLWGLAGLLGLLGLGGLVRRNDHDRTTVGRVPQQPRTTGGASSTDR